MTRRGQSVIELKPVFPPPRPMTDADLQWLRARRVRMRDLTADEGQLAFLHFDSWAAGSVERRDLIGADIAAAERILRRLQVNFRTPDAVHMAVVQRLGATPVTFDAGMARAARALGMAVATP